MRGRELHGSFTGSFGLQAVPLVVRCPAPGLNAETMRRRRRTYMDGICPYDGQMPTITAEVAAIRSADRACVRAVKRPLKWPARYLGELLHV